MIKNIFSFFNPHSKSRNDVTQIVV
jgi:hypothetical protein